MLKSSCHFFNINIRWCFSHMNSVLILKDHCFKVILCWLCNTFRTWSGTAKWCTQAGTFVLCSSSLCLKLSLHWRQKIRKTIAPKQAEAPVTKKYDIFHSRCSVHFYLVFMQILFHEYLISHIIVIIWLFFCFLSLSYSNHFIISPSSLPS
jgi:hypothetical protein